MTNSPIWTQRGIARFALVESASRAMIIFASLIACALYLVPVDAAAQQVERLSLEELRERFITPSDRFMKLGGLQLRYRDEGPRDCGNTILLLHGSNSTIETWNGVAKVLVASGYRVLRFDQPPFGLSSSISDEAMASLPDSDSLVKGFLDRLGVRSVIVAGVSSGGTMGYYFAAKYPDRVRALIISNAPSDPVVTTGLELSADLAAAMAREEAIGVRDREFWAAYLRYFGGDADRVTDDQIDLFFDMGRRQNEANLFHLYALAGNQEETLARLAQVTVPTLILWGKSDVMLPAEAAYSLRDKLTAVDASLIFFDDVGHYPPIETPARFAAVMDHYIRYVVDPADKPTP